MRLAPLVVLVAITSLVAGACGSDDTGTSLGTQGATPGGAGADGAASGDGGAATGDTGLTPRPNGDADGPDLDGVEPAGDGMEPGGDAADPGSGDAADGGTDPTHDTGATDAGPWSTDGAGDDQTTECEADQALNCEGGCTAAAWVGDGWCDTMLDCEALGFDGGDCVPECGDGTCNGDETYQTCLDDCPAPVAGDNHPCAPSDAPGSSDEAVTACACAQDAFCCTTSWDAFCIQLAQDPCGAKCDCSDQACGADADCGDCYGDACVGMWGCADGQCSQGDAVTCEAPDGAGCVTSQCDPASGLCVDDADDSLCDDASACTADSCDAETGECAHAATDLCGDQHPCVVSDMPGSGDPAVQACLCAADPYCCNTAWDPMCVAGAGEACGIVCDCMEAPADALGCETDGDCVWCGESACTGPFVCQAGTCQATAPVKCDPAGDTECSKSECDPETGVCEVVTSDAFCDDGDPCTLDACEAESGACFHTAVEDCAITHPCQPATTPASNDEGINACVCAIAPACCEAEWQSYCIEIAQDQCELTCDCTEMGPATLVCTENADCAYCDDGDLCNGAWSCQGGACASLPAVVCDTGGDLDCLVTVCVPESGACEQVADPTACDDGDPCTDDSCDGSTGACSSAPNAACGVNHPCVSAQFPTSNDPEVTACVCEVAPYCCEIAWINECVEISEGNCGMVCACDNALDPVACDVDADCMGCDDGDLCNGTWGCVDHICMALNDAVACDPTGNMGCLENTCVSPGGGCEFTPIASSCDDGAPCTADSCDTEGVCSNTPLDGCTPNHPCATSEFPESTDEDITACVCEMDGWCCQENWDTLCVGEAEDDCGAICDCTDPDAELMCETDAECGWCTDDLCGSPWSCVAGHCTAGAPVVCDAAADTECQTHQCDGATGTCILQTITSACDDDEPCTADSCTAAGACEHQALTGCEGGPFFDCLGPNEPSAAGCGVVESYAGCCDPWGRVTWCQDGSTYCIACQENPSCGWQGVEGYYDCGMDGSEDPSGAAPMMCPAFAP